MDENYTIVIDQNFPHAKHWGMSEICNKLTEIFGSKPSLEEAEEVYDYLQKKRTNSK